MREILRHLFLPHHSNNHRAKVLHLDAFVVYVFVFLAASLTIRGVHKHYPDILGYATNIYVDQLVAATNAKRAQAGLPVLRVNEKLSVAAAHKAQDMFRENYWAHTSPSGKTPWQFIIDSGYRYSVAGENLAKNFQDSNSVVAAWMASPSHRDNILKSSYREIGFAVVNGVLNGEETTLVVQMFGTQPSQAPAPVRTARPVSIVTQEEPAAEAAPAPASETVASAFSSVIKKPFIHIPSFTRELSMMFIGILLGVFLVDAYLVARRRIFRATGRTLAHFLFLGMTLIVISGAGIGTIL